MPQKIPQLDAVRGIAIILVFMNNTSEKYPDLHLEHFFGNGWMGVDLFFVLSGFLITGILLDSKNAPEYFKNFYIRRCLRILPLYYAVVLLMFVVVPHLRPVEAHLIFEKSSPWWAYPLFLQNFLLAVPTLAAGPLGVTWSLAIEEQFYLIWPALVRWSTRAQLQTIAITTIFLSPVAGFYLSSHHRVTYSNFLCRIVGPMMGALLAVLVRSDAFEPLRYLKRAWLALPAALLVAFLCESSDTRWLAFVFVALAATSFIYLALFSPHRGLQAVLHNRFLIYTGTISYGLYLLHKIPFDMAQSFHVAKHPAVLLPFLFLAAYLLAMLSWHLLEQPFLKLKRFFPSGVVRARSAFGDPPETRQQPQI